MIAFQSRKHAHVRLVTRSPLVTQLHRNSVTTIGLCHHICGQSSITSGGKGGLRVTKNTF
jgi:hypothetical protein